MKSERLGMLMVAAALAVIAAVGALLFDYQRSTRLAQIRTQGVSLARVLARMPLSELVPPGAGPGPLEVVGSTQADADFAYGAVVAPDQRVLAQTTAPGVVVPAAAIDLAPAAWHGERVVDAPGPDGARYLEMHAPVLAGGELAGFVRVGYREPDLGLLVRDLPWFAWLALPIFLLAPVFYYLVRREIRPLREASGRMADLLDEGAVRRVELTATGEVGEFVRSFNRALEAAGERLRALEHEREGAITWSKVVSYQKARIESVLQSLPDGVLVLDETAAVTYANEKAALLLGVEATALAGRRPADWRELPELTPFFSGYDATAARKQAGGFVELEPPGAGGRRVALTAYPLFAPREGHDIFGTLVVVSDVTAENHAREARKELIAQLSHELKTPLQVIGMHAELLLDDDSGAPETRMEAGNVIRDEVERVTDLINNMLSLSRIEMGSLRLERKRTRLNDLLADAFETVARNGRELGLEFRLELPAEPVTLNVDKALLRVAVNNLLTNAIKYNRPGGEVVLGLRDEPDRFCIYVRDTGVGIRPEDQPRVFDKFFRGGGEASRRAGGHGLGLSLAREIVQVHLGELRLDSEPGRGSEFVIELRKTPMLMKEAV